MRLRLLPVVIALLLAACGDEGVDGPALQATMTDFVARHAHEYGSLDLPVYERKRGALLSVVPPGEDALALCDDLAAWVERQGFDGVDIRVRRSLGGTALATGSSGGRCEAE